MADGPLRLAGSTLSVTGRTPSCMAAAMVWCHKRSWKQGTLEESTTARHRYLDVQRAHEEALEQQGGSKRRATTTRTSTPAPAELAPLATLSHEGSPELPRRVVDSIIGNLQHLPDSWPLIRFDLMLHKSANYYAIWRRFLHLNKYLRNFSPDTANDTIDAHAGGLIEHLVQFLAEWIIMALEPARVITKVRAQTSAMGAPRRL